MGELARVWAVPGPGRLRVRGGCGACAVRVSYASAPALPGLGHAGGLMQGGRWCGTMGDERGELQGRAAARAA